MMSHSFRAQELQNLNTGINSRGSNKKDQPIRVPLRLGKRKNEFLSLESKFMDQQREQKLTQIQKKKKKSIAKYFENRKNRNFHNVVMMFEVFKSK
jgi:hypothetical protein